MSHHGLQRIRAFSLHPDPARNTGRVGSETLKAVRPVTGPTVGPVLTEGLAVLRGVSGRFRRIPTVGRDDSRGSTQGEATPEGGVEVCDVGPGS